MNNKSKTIIPVEGRILSVFLFNLGITNMHTTNFNGLTKKIVIFKKKQNKIGKKRGNEKEIMKFVLNIKFE